MLTPPLSLAIARSVLPSELNSVFGAPVTLTATVSPSSATGPVTFYDGVAILGVAQLSNGNATLIAARPDAMDPALAGVSPDDPAVELPPIFA